MGGIAMEVDDYMSIWIRSKKVEGYRVKSIIRGFYAQVLIQELSGMLLRQMQR